MNTVAIFRWTGTLPTDEEVAEPAIRYSRDFGEQWAYQAGLPVASSLLESVRHLGHETDDRPYYGDGAWHFTIDLEEGSFSVTVLWIPKGENNDYFAVQPSLRRGCLASLFVPPPPEAALRPICSVLQTALADLSPIEELEWVREI
ncbi:MAG TPA: hypothetical protein VFE62_29840 [Gemmataceae bacterium]|nr:hypothetical protein [Gemmataceae bacterium]